MMRIPRKAVLWLTLGATALVMLGQPAFASTSGEFFFPCALSHRATDDPIVFPGQPGATHMHDFVGNDSTDEYSTPDSLFAATTGCREQQDKSAYWFPEVSRFGVPQTPAKIQVYYRNGSA